jgi:hypothetical protein
VVVVVVGLAAWFAVALMTIVKRGVLVELGIGLCLATPRATLHNDG